jgi:predicted MFS family arabinose efflux permease
MFFSSNYFYAYQGAITAYNFNGRTRALSSLLTGAGSIIGSILIGFITDSLPYKRRTRALIGCAAVLLLNVIVWVGGLVFQVGFMRNTEGHRLPKVWDWTSSESAGPLILLMS